LKHQHPARAKTTDYLQTQNVKCIDAQTRSFIARTMVIGTMLAILGTEVFMFVHGDGAGLRALDDSIIALMSGALGYYLRSKAN
jgi:hypothetical protein